MRVLVKSLGSKRKGFNCGGSTSTHKDQNCELSTAERRASTKEGFKSKCSKKCEVAQLKRQTDNPLRSCEDNCPMEYRNRKNPTTTSRGCDWPCTTQNSSPQQDSCLKPTKRGCHQPPQIFSPAQQSHSRVQFPCLPTPQSVSFYNEQFKSRCPPTWNQQQQFYPRSEESCSARPHSSTLPSQFPASQSSCCQPSPSFHPTTSNPVPPCSTDSYKAPTRHSSSRHTDSCEQCSPVSRSPCVYSSLPHQRHVGPIREELPGSSQGQCPCGGGNGPTRVEHFVDNQFDGNRNTSGNSGRPCRCKCQSSKGSYPGGGCGGQSCGGIYSCAGSGGGTCCFPRNTKRRSGPECCGGGNPG